jgi:hypothetical protein
MKSSSSPGASGEIRLTCSTILNGELFPFDTVLPFATVDDLREFVRPYVIRNAEAPSEPVSHERDLSFRLHQSYGVDSEGYRFGDVDRQAAQMESVEAERARIEAAMNQPPDQTVADALELARIDHATNIERQKAQTEATARRQDAEQAWIREQQERDAANADVDGFSSASDQPAEDLEQPKPKKMRKRFLNRNGTWLRATRVSRKKIGEAVYVRNGPGDFIQVGVVNKHGRLPAMCLEEK